ncbi:hypothetical protein BD626DRAFT_571700 [Schizophyllum amplum]|uniref:Uncharacterized protein n=1 Tax=Schizophyllum amplum TaxID=97359 RepID=A0A550C782_9AGAR|nr:hypothetical protein BD626DRAFT_571700 [Auriculariopsis ampla]
MFSFKSLSIAATLALSAFAAPVDMPGFAAVSSSVAGAASTASGTAIAAASSVSASATKAAAAATSSVASVAGRDLLDVDADVDAEVEVLHRDLLDVDADVDADVEVGRRHDQTLLDLVDQAIVDLTETCQALTFLQPANATEKAVGDLLNDVKAILGDLLTDVQALVGLDVSAVLGDVTDLNAVGSIVADLLKLVFTALGGVLNVVNVAPSDLLSQLLKDIAGIVAELLKVVLGLVDGVLGLVGGLLGVVVGLLGDVLPIVMQLNVSMLLQVLAL